MKKNLIKVLSILISSILVLSFSSCGNRNNKVNDESEKNTDQPGAIGTNSEGEAWESYEEITLIEIPIEE